MIAAVGNCCCSAWVANHQTSSSYHHLFSNRWRHSDQRASQQHAAAAGAACSSKDAVSGAAAQQPSAAALEVLIRETHIRFRHHPSRCVCRFLEQHCLLSELRDTVNCLQADKQGLKDQSHADHATHAPCSTDLDSLAKHLQAALLAQHLQLPANGQQAHQQRNPLLVQEQQPGAGAGDGTPAACLRAL